MPALDDNAKLVLRTIVEQDMDGYTLARQTGLKTEDLEKAVDVLSASDLLRVKGDQRGPRFLESWFQAVPGAKHLLLSIFR